MIDSSSRLPTFCDLCFLRRTGVFVLTSVGRTLCGLLLTCSLASSNPPQAKAQGAEAPATSNNQSAASADTRPQWIWGQSNRSADSDIETCHFRKTLSIPADVEVADAELQIACDDRYVVRINGTLVGVGTDWHTMDRYDVTHLLKSGTNSLTVVARNDGDSAGLLVRLRWSDSQGNENLSISDTSWQAAVQNSGTWDPNVGLAQDWHAAVSRGTWPEATPWGNEMTLGDTVRRLLSAQGTTVASDLALSDGDRVVLIGDTLIERAQQFGYLESLLVTHFPGREITVRNLGWSGDTVFGISRARFGSAEDGFEHLEVQTHSLQPTVIILGYGANDSLAGPDGLPRFQEGLDRLLVTLAATGARIVLFSPILQENLGPPLPDPDQTNRHRRLYSEAMRRMAENDGHRFVELFQPIEAVTSPGHHWTYNGIHLSRFGYYKLACQAAAQLGWWHTPWQLQIDVAGHAYDAQGVTVHSMQLGSENEEQSEQVVVAMDLVSGHLPFDFVAQPGDADLGEPEVLGVQRLQIAGLAEGEYELAIDDNALRQASAEQWRRGVSVRSGPDFDQFVKLRERIVAKNELFFYRWRPQNETYLFLFRKHEQGNNAVEIPQFDPLILAEEHRIRELSVPQRHRWTLRRLGPPRRRESAE